MQANHPRAPSRATALYVQWSGLLLRSLRSRLLTLLPVAGTSGCAAHGAPSFVLFGAFFPAWMLLAGIGILAAIVTRVVLVTTGLADFLAAQLLVCVSTGLMVAVLTWLLWFAR
jgi:hypothetical protein